MISILKTGTSMRIVDTGRSGYRRYGISEGGAMDLQSYLCANTLAGNHIDANVLELYQAGHQIKFHKSSSIAITGASGDIKLNDKPISNNQLIHVENDDILTIGKLSNGCRLYVAISGGIICEQILGSSSTLPGVHDSGIRRGMTFTISESAYNNSYSHLKAIHINLSSPIICTHGPEYHLLNAEQRNWIEATEFTIHQHSNTMGYRVTGAPCPSYTSSSINTSPVITGTVQLPPDGMPLILMRDAQTTGGYPRILSIKDSHINQLAQRDPGCKIRFKIL